MSRRQSLLNAALVGVIFLDQVTKWLMTHQGFVSFNKGISFGLFSLFPHLALTMALSLMLLFVWYYYRFAWQRQPWASGLFFGGGISNLIDRVLFDGVRDWIPVPGLNLQNNLADYAIAVGLVWLIWFGLRRSYNQSVAPEVEPASNQPTS